ncbi:phage tail protein [Paenibacillus sp. UNC499MF]|uniref:phage tail protein n=1 Tax=Paenibacillus sp. UNC499MF TaxID=1502751 RepID=UPI00089F940F|nr:tail fiber protein [Paenibacillus sp. UNC499MF]SEG73918.1 Microcystin-dependent protein [Paenibacillus sp. UNC499MF]
MSEPFVGEIRLFANNYAPRGWAFCEGQTLSINTNQALYSLIGTVYGGDGKTNFKLPDLRGRVPIHVSSTTPLGQSAGEAAHTLTVNEMPAHTHQVSASGNPGSATTPASNVWADEAALYEPLSTPTVAMNAGTMSIAGGSQPHSNMQPYLVANYAIALVGIYPSRN